MPKDSGPDSTPPQRVMVPLSRPLRHPMYRRLWLANLVSNLGTWTQTFASAWLIASLAHSASTTTLVQTATYLPIFLFAVFAGAVADRVHRPKFLFLCNVFLALCALGMAAVTMSGSTSATPVLALTFCLGTGNAFMWPAWQASMSGLVEPDEVEAAATLNNLSYNVAAIVGPALVGLLFAWIGAGALFLANALSFIGLLGIYWQWWHGTEPEPIEPSHVWDSLKAGMQAAFGSTRYRFILLNVCVVFFCTIAFASMLPLFVRDVLHMESRAYGSLMGCLGGGAVFAAFLLPSLRARVDKMRLLTGSLFIYACMLLALPHVHALPLLVPLVLAGGMAWSATVSTMNAAAQSTFPPEIRARTLAIYLFVMAGGYTAGSLLWGAIAEYFGVAAALTSAGCCILLHAIVLATAKRKSPI